MIASLPFDDPMNQSMDKNKETEQPVDIIYNIYDLSVSPFNSYLTEAFNRKGIKQFYGLKLFLVIFSCGYASSASCLENLVELLELSRHDKNRYEVVPVFYGVSPLDVKHQSGTLTDAFIELERSFSSVQVTKWRCALTETAELQGHAHVYEKSEESEFVEEIAQDVFEKLYPTEEIGIHKRQLDIENLLCTQSWGVRTLGILGEPGIGKTTLTRALHRRMCSDYDESCFIEGFHSRYKMRPEPLHGDFLCMTPMEDFYQNNPDVESPSDRQKRVLVALDDVQNARDAESFLGAVDQFGPGSLIIITSKDRQVLEQCHVNDIYELKGLNDDDALKLFTRFAFGNGLIEQNLLDLSMRVVVKCSDGNPSTLISYTEKLKGKTKTQMESTLLDICHDKCIDAKKNTVCRISYGNDHDNGALEKSISNGVGHAAQRIISDNAKHLVFFDHPSLVRESLPSDLKVSRLDHDLAVQSFFQGFACQLHKIWERGGYYKSFSRLERINLGQLETLVEVEELSESRPLTDKPKCLQVLNLSGCNEIKRFPRVVWTIREFNLEGTGGIQEIKSETTKYSQLVKQESTATTLE